MSDDTPRSEVAGRKRQLVGGEAVGLTVSDQAGVVLLARRTPGGSSR